MMRIYQNRQMPPIQFVFIMISLLLGACSTDFKQEMSNEIQITEIKSGQKQEEYSQEPPSLNGTWKSPKPERAGNGRYSIRELIFRENSWEQKYTLADDKKMTKILFTYRAKGTLQLQNPSKRIPGAYLITYRFQKKSLTANSKDQKFLREFGFQDCKNLSSEETDISSYGCGIFTRVSECPIDFDLIRQHGNKLEIGDRYTEFSSCTEDKRPVALGFVLEKQD